MNEERKMQPVAEFEADVRVARELLISAERMRAVMQGVKNPLAVIFALNQAAADMLASMAHTNGLGSEEFRELVQQQAEEFVIRVTNGLSALNARDAKDAPAAQVPA